MKIKYLKIGIIAFLAFLLSTDLLAQESNLDNFDEVAIKDIDVVLIQGNKPSYRTDPPEASVNIKQEGSKLTLKKNGSSNILKVYLTCPNIKALHMLSSGDITSEGQLQVDHLNINVLGSGDVKLNFKASAVNAIVSGSGNLLLEGKTVNLNATLAGSGDLKASRLIAENVSIELTGSGDAAINVEKNLNANIIGSGDIKYIGNPQARNVNIIGTGSITETSPASVDDELEIELNNEVKININQGKGSSSDTTRLSIGDRKIIIIDDDDDDEVEKSSQKKNSSNSVKHIWSGFEFGLCAYSNKQFNTTLTNGGPYALDYLRSNIINLNPFERNFNIYKNYIALTTGLGFQFNRFMFENNTSLIPFKDSIQIVDNNISYKKNMIKMSYLTLPLLLQFNTSKIHDKSFHIALGGQVAVKLGSRIKQVYDINGRKNRDINKSDLNLNPFQYGLTARVGYGNFNVFANYNLSELFKSGKGPELYPFQLGITLVPW